MPSIAEAKEALAIYEARGDFETATEIRQAIQQAESPAPVGPSFTERMAVKRAESDARLAELRSRRAPEETGIFEDITSGFGAGVVGFGEGTALGLASLMEEEGETAARERIQSIAESFRPEGGDPESAVYKLSSALGSVAGFGGLGIGAAALGAPGAAIGAGLGAVGIASMKGEASEDARAAGATVEEREAAVNDPRVFLAGLLEVIPIARVIPTSKLPELAKLLEKIPPEKVETIGERIYSAGVTGTAEGLQEATSNVLLKPD